MNPGIGRGMTATTHHWVESHISISMKWADAEAIFITLDALVRNGTGVAPSHEEPVVAFRDLLRERVRVLRTVVVEQL